MSLSVRSKLCSNNDDKDAIIASGGAGDETGGVADHSFSSSSSLFEASSKALRKMYLVPRVVALLVTVPISLQGLKNSRDYAAHLVEISIPLD